MANRDLDFSPQVTNVVPEQPQDGLLTAGLDVLNNIGQASASAKALSAASQTSLAFRQLDQQYRTTYAGDPNSPEGAAFLANGRKEITDSLSANVPSIAMLDYQKQAVELGKASDASNTLWGTRQLVTNARADIQTSYQTNLSQASMDGRQFASSGSPASEVEGALHYAQLSQQMMTFAGPVIGNDRAALYLKNFQQDYTKTFVSSVAETNPQMAYSLLQQPGIADKFRPQDIDDMEQLIARTTKAQALIKSGQITKSDSGLMDIVNDPQSSYYEKRASIDQMDMEGSITPKAASAARRVLNSSKDLDAQTDTPKMAEVINQAYDLNSQSNMDPSSYLMGVRNLQTQVMNMQADGTLTAQDAHKLQNQVTNLTNARLASATQSAGNDFYEANQKFMVLPPENRAQATRALFYLGQGQNWTQDQYAQHAQQVIDTVNQQRRTNALNTVSGINAMSDADFIKSIPNASAQSITETAKKYGMTEQQVIQQLRQNAAGKINAQRRKTITRVAPRADEPDTTNGIRLDAPAPSGLGGDEDETPVEEQ